MKVIKNGVSHTVSSIKYVNFVFTKAMYGTKLIWSLIKSCFGSGTWISTANWSDTETWKYA